jgi:serine/threonine-protein kinase
LNLEFVSDFEFRISDFPREGAMDEPAQSTDPRLPPHATPPHAPVVSAEADLSGRVLDDFRLLRRIGQGGMGQVYLAEQVSLRRQVALKVVRPQLAETAAAAETLLKRFRAEAEAVARATHANIVQIYAIGQAGDLSYMALEFVEGRNLRDFVEKHKPIGVVQGLKIMAHIAAALQRAGELHLVHRDIKPENILVGRNGDVKVADFGLSRCFDQPLGLTRSGVVMGTPLYMSPEQVEMRNPVDHRSDIYSFGATSYFMFAATPPFRGETPIEVAYQHVHQEPTPLAGLRPDLPAELCTLVHRMMAKKPTERYQTAAEVAREIERLRQQPVFEDYGGAAITMQAKAPVTMAIPIEPGDRSWYRRHVLGIGAVALALVIGLTVGWLRHRPAVPLGPPDPEGPDGAARVLFSAKEREEGLREQVKQLKPYGPLDDRGGLTAAVNLGLLYLEDHRRLDEAEAFFKGLCPAKKDDCNYRLLSELGHAMVLAFRNKPAESNDAFLALANELDRLDKGNGVSEKDVQIYRHLWKTNPPAPALREMVARALNHNKVNAGKLPQPLERLCAPPGPAVKGGAG